MLAGAAIIFFAYIGFDSVSTHAEEAKQPNRDVPIGIVASLHHLHRPLHRGGGRADRHGHVHADRRRTPASPSAFGSVGLGWAEVIIAIAGVAGITSVLLVMMLSGPRVFLAMARDGMVPTEFFGDGAPEVPHALEEHDPDRRVRGHRWPASCRSTRCCR